MLVTFWPLTPWKRQAWWKPVGILYEDHFTRNIEIGWKICTPHTKTDSIFWASCFLCILLSNKWTFLPSLVPIGSVVSEKKIKNRQHNFWHLWVSFLCTSNQQKKNIKFSEDHPMTIPTKFGANWPIGFDGCKGMAIHHLTLWVRWAKQLKPPIQCPNTLTIF